MCKIGGVTLYSKGEIVVTVIHLSSTLTPAPLILALLHIGHTTS